MDQVEQPETTPAIRSTFPIVRPDPLAPPRDPFAPPDLSKVQVVVATFSDRFQRGPRLGTGSAKTDAPESDTGSTTEDAPESDTGSATEDAPQPDPALAADAEEDLQMSLPIARMIEIRLESFEKLSEDWTVVDRAGILSESGKVVQRVVTPTASKITYQALHATVYRYLEPLLELDQVAELLDVPGWREEVARVYPHAETHFRAFIESDNAARESELQDRLTELIATMAAIMRVKCRKDSRLCTNVRGTLAADEFEVRGVSDLAYCSDSDFFLAAEIKTARSFSTGQFWYRGSRGTQVFNTLYSYKCPTLLVTQRHFKLFIENEARDRVYTFPAVPTAENATEEQKFAASMACRATANELFDVLVICLMRAHPKQLAAARGPAAATQTHLPSRKSSAVRSDVTPHTKKGSSSTSASRGSPTANRIQGRTAHMPQFFTGEYDASGRRIYRTVYVSPPEKDAESTSDGSESEEPSSSSDDKNVVARVDSGVTL